MNEAEGRLRPEEIEEIEHEATILPARRAVGIEALKVVQRHRGWVSDAALEALARHLGVSSAELESLATFYNLIFRRPVGRHVILVCDSVSCWLMQGEKLMQTLCEQLGIAPGQTTADGRFTLLPIACLGTCDHAPALMIDRDLHRDLSVEQLEELLARYE